MKTLALQVQDTVSTRCDQRCVTSISEEFQQNYCACTRENLWNVLLTSLPWRPHVFIISFHGLRFTRIVTSRCWWEL